MGCLITNVKLEIEKKKNDLKTEERLLGTGRGRARSTWRVEYRKMDGHD